MNEIGYSPKDLVFGEDGRRKLLSGVKKMAGAVKSTLGPSGNTVLIEPSNHLGGMTVTKDGVTVAKSVDLLDPVENLAVRMMKQAADRTATVAGDGTTTAIVLTEAMVENGMRVLGSNTSLNRTEVLREMTRLVDTVVDVLKTRKKQVSKKMLLDVATISASNDKEIGRIIADVYNEVGRDGIVTVERSQNSETYSEISHGFRVERGYLSNLFVNDQKRDEVIYEDVMILVSDAEISNILQIEQVLKPVISENKRLLIIAPCSTNVVNTLAANKIKNNLKVVAIQPPQFGYKQHELMSDIAVSVGATYFSEKTGDDLSLMTYADLGHAAKVVVSRDSTVIVNSDYRTDGEEVERRVAQLRDAYEESSRKEDREFILSRIASLSGGVGVIFVGGNTDIEQKELFDRVDDAVCAVRSALEEGILPGAGRALHHISENFDEAVRVRDGAEHMAAREIISSAIGSPLRQILLNSGYCDLGVYSDNSLTYNEGICLKTGAIGNLFKLGVVDPMKVTRSALENAVSVATTILSTNAIVTMARSYETQS